MLDYAPYRSVLLGKLMPEIPLEFDRHHLAQLRALLILARSDRKKWSSAWSNASKSSNDDRILQRFISEGGSLDFTSAARPVLQSVYDAVYWVLRHDRGDLRDAVKPVFQAVYGKHGFGGWEQAETCLSIKPFDLGKRINGIYLSYRHSTSQASKEIALTPLRIFTDSRIDETAILFEMCYPLRKNVGSAKITGRVLAIEKNLHFLGFDEGSTAPYLMSGYLKPGTEKIDAITGLAIRCNTQNTIFSARVYAERVSELDWPKAQSKADILNPKSNEYLNILERIGKFIDNDVADHNKVLKHYEK